MECCVTSGLTSRFACRSTLPHGENDQCSATSSRSLRKGRPICTSRHPKKHSLSKQPKQTTQANPKCKPGARNESHLEWTGPRCGVTPPSSRRTITAFECLRCRKSFSKKRNHKFLPVEGPSQLLHAFRRRERKQRRGFVLCGLKRSGPGDSRSGGILEGRRGQIGGRVAFEPPRASIWLKTQTNMNTSIENDCDGWATCAGWPCLLRWAAR